jgi:hypothetical protein
MNVEKHESFPPLLYKAIDQDQIILLSAQILQNYLRVNDADSPDKAEPTRKELLDLIINCAKENTRLVRLFAKKVGSVKLEYD